MEKIDLKDRKILYYLEQDSKQSFRTIGRKVGLTKDVVTSRVKKLQEKGIIYNYYTVIDTYKLGFTYLRFYLKFQYASPQIKKEIIDNFVNNKFSILISSLLGSYDLLFFFCIKNLPEVYYFWEKIMNKYRDYFANYVFSIYFKENLYDFSFLITENGDKISERSKLEIFGGVGKIDLDDIDFEILKIIAAHARLPTVDIAKSLNSTTSIIHYRMKKMMTLGVIQGFKTYIDVSKIGYKQFKVDIVLRNHKYEQQIMNYLENNPYLRGRDMTLGYVDLELTFHFKHVDQLNQMIEDLFAKFPDSIRSYNYFSEQDVYKYCYLPER